MTSHDTVLLVDRGAEFTAKLRSLLQAESLPVAETDDPAAAAAHVAERGPAVVVTGPSVTLPEAVSLAQRISALDSEVLAVAVVESVDTATMRQAMKAGFHDVLSASEQTWSEVAESVIDAYRTAVARRSGTGAPAEPRRGGRIVSVMGTKGGVGKSVIATNLSAALARRGRSVVLVDLDLRSGDDGIMLRIEPSHTIGDAAAVSDRLDTDLLQGFLRLHDSGARVLLAPARPEEADIVTAARVARILELLRGLADVVVIDTPSAWDETTLAAADASDSILAVTGMELPSIKDTGQMIARLAQLGRTNGTVNVVLNRADSKVLIEEKDVERALGRGVVSRIPSDRAVPRSVNRGVPLVIEAPRSGVSKAVFELADAITKGGADA